MQQHEFEQYKTNVKAFDDDHFRIINLFESMLDESEFRKVASFISLLPFEWALHIMLEERYMYENKYSHLDFHIKQHNNISNLIKQLDCNVKENEDESQIRTKLQEVFNMIKYHIMTEDKAYGIVHNSYDFKS
jgi:hemerythrin-like metal-binding protein